MTTSAQRPTLRALSTSPTSHSRKLFAAKERSGEEDNPVVRRLVRYVQHLYEQWQQDPANKKGPSGASDFLCGLQHKTPKARGHLKVAWRALTSWQDRCPTIHRHAWPIILVLAMHRIGWISVGLAVDRLDFAVAYLINFVTLARPGEMSVFALGEGFLQQ